jgi:predicted lipoprotein with Yx(FWY)xxD motif
MKLSAKTLVSFAAIAVLALALAGCGSSDSNSTKTASADSSANAAASTSAAPSTSAAATITTKDAAKLGTILASGGKNMTVYLFEADKNGTSTCDGDCAAAWPPVLTKGNPTAKPSAESAKLGTAKRSDGTTQVTYAGHPLYYFVKDKDAEDVYGNGITEFGAEWYALTPSGKSAESASSSDSSNSSAGSGY